MDLLVKPEMLTSYIYGPTFGNAETVSFYLLHNVSTLNQCPFFLFFSSSSGRFSEFRVFLFLIFDFWFWPLFFDSVLCLLCYLEFVFFHLVNYLTTTFIRNSLNSLVLLNLFIYGLLYFTFVLLYIFCVCIRYFA